MNNRERIKELEYLNNEHRGVIGILMDEREVLRAKIEALKADNKRLKGFCWESDEAIEFLKAVKEAQEK